MSDAAFVWYDPDEHKPLSDEWVLGWFVGDVTGRLFDACYRRQARDKFEERWYPCKPTRWMYIKGPKMNESGGVK